MPIPKTMKAMLLSGHGGPEKLVFENNKDFVGKLVVALPHQFSKYQMPHAVRMQSNAVELPPLVHSVFVTPGKTNHE